MISTYYRSPCLSAEALAKVGACRRANGEVRHSLRMMVAIFSNLKSSGKKLSILYYGLRL